MNRAVTAGCAALALTLSLAAAAPAAPAAPAADFSGPAEWRSVRTNEIARWNAERRRRASARFRFFPGVTADLDRREVRLLAEAVGHRAGITTEFLLIGPMSDRAYEALAVTAASPGDIARAVEALGIRRGGGVGSIPFRFWTCGERFAPSIVSLDRPEDGEQPVSDFIRDADPKNPLVGKKGLVFTGGDWAGRCCLTDTNMPASVCSLYNAPSSIFDLPGRVGQSEVYGRISVARRLPRGALLEVILRPLLPPDGRPRVLPLLLRVYQKGGAARAACSDGKGKKIFDRPIAETIAWLRSQVDAGREPFITVDMDDAMTLADAARAAKVFALLEDGGGIKLDGRAPGGLFPLAYLPQEKWRDRKDRIPQPFELHLSRGKDGAIEKKLTFIEEDWSVEGLDPKLTPRDHPFREWSEFLPLVEKSGGPENKVNLLFVFAPGDLPLREALRGPRAAEKRLPLVYIFRD